MQTPGVRNDIRTDGRRIKMRNLKLDTSGKPAGFKLRLKKLGPQPPHLQRHDGVASTAG